MRGRDPFDRSSAAFSVTLHVVLVVVAWLSTLYEPPEIEFFTPEIVMVSPPAALQAEEAAPAVEEMTVETPDPTPPPPPEPEPEEEEVVVEQEDPEPTPPDPEPVTEVADDPTPATTTEEPEPDATETGEDINVRLEGVERDYPAYYGNIIRQIRNCFRPPPGDWVTTIFFNIQRDGSVSGMRFVQRSGNVDFDFKAMGAVECAGRPAGFGPLPEDLPYDRLPVQFDFKPNRDELRMRVGLSRPAIQ